MKGSSLAIAACMVAACAGACEAAPSGLTTDTDSRTLPDPKLRLDFLARYLRLKSPVTDTEFTIRYHDNSGGSVPGPSDYDIRAAMQLADDGAAWHASWEVCPSDLAAVPAWAHGLLDRRPAWRAPSAPAACFRDPHHRASVAYIFAADHLVVYGTSS